MSIYVYITDQCIREAMTLGFWNDVEKLQKKVEYIQNTGGLTRYPQPFMVKKFGKTGRMVIEEKIIEEDCLLCFLRFFARSDPEYFREFLGNPAQFHRENTPSDELSQAYLKERRNKPITTLPSLSPIEENYLYSLDYSSYQEEGSILESKEWVSRIQSKELSTYRSRYWELVFELVDKEGNCELTTITNQRHTILFRYFAEYKKWFLIAPLNSSDPDDEYKLRKKYENVFSNEKQIDEMDLRRLSQRSYPTVMVYDDDIWINRIEASRTANMALSPEEVEVLDSILHNVHKTGGYPLFINGRPGSGKSTVLQYLFAEHLYHHLSVTSENRLLDPPIYLTYNDSLLRRAKETISDILRCDSKKVSEKPINLDDKVTREIFDQAFGHFHEFLYSLLSQEDQAKLTKEKYVNYSRFCQMWAAKYLKSPDPEIRRLSPELAWHTIRTFIKGMRQEGSDYFDTESYKVELPRDQKTVTTEVFERIHSLWDSWYRPLCENDGYWDDQDLTWRVLSNEKINLSKFPAIFCDESQDFTYLELDLIFRLSLYSQRQVPSYLLSRVPFAFAGDPFQTLNPTGFNWQATQANFHDKIVRQLDKNQSTKLLINFRTLGFNYRSTVNIVQFCNLIQLIRGIAFGIPDLVPQSSWFNRSTNMLVYFEDIDAVGQALIREQSELVIILPCKEGEEREFVQKDPFLQTVALDGSGELIRNVQSPIRAKGLDFQRVVLYKFGQECIENYPKLIEIIQNSHAHQLSNDEQLPLEYFVNRLYVAASRPERRLFIIDSGEGLDKFWSFAKDIELRDLLARYQDNSAWSFDDLGRIQRGSRDNWDDDRDNPEELGNQFFKDGKEKRDTYQLKQAIINYRACNPPKEDKAQLCLALIYEFEENYEKAGNQYAAMNRGNDARKCYWAAESYAAITELGKRDPSQINTLEHRAASFMTGQKSFNECKTFLHVVYQRASEDVELRGKAVKSNTWTKIINEIVQYLAKSSSNTVDDAWKEIYTEFESFRIWGVVVEISLELAKIAFYASNLSASRSLLDQAKPNLRIAPTWIIEVFAETTTYPQNLEHFERLEKWDRIIEEYKKHPRVELKSANVETIFKALLKDEALESALIFVKQYPSSLRYGRLISHSLRAGNNERATQLAESLLDEFIQEGSWPQAIEFASKGRIEGLDNNQVRIIQESDLDETWRNAQLIRLLARSIRLSDESTVSDKDKVSKYLNKVLLQGKAGQLIDKLKVAEAGAAIERANKITDALVFYERIFENQQNNQPRDIRLAKVRWIICKQRQQNHVTDPRAIKRISDEIKEKMLEWKISDADLKSQPEFPGISTENLDRTTQHESSPSGVFHISDDGNEIPVYCGERQYNCKTSAKKRRLEIRDTDTDNLVIAYFDRGQLSCPDEPQLLSHHPTDKGTTWYVKEWNIQISFVANNHNNDILIEDAANGSAICCFQV